MFKILTLIKIELTSRDITRIYRTQINWSFSGFINHLFQCYFSFFYIL